MTRHALFAAMLLAGTACSAQRPATPPAAEGRANLPPSTALPFKVEAMGAVDEPFAMAFLPDGRLLVTEKKGRLMLRQANGVFTPVSGVPAVAQGGQGGLLDVAVAPDFARSGLVYLTYAEPQGSGSQLTMARGTLSGSALQSVGVLWRSGSAGEGGQFGAVIAFAPDGQSLFLASGERQRFTPAQDPDQALGKIMHLTLDGKPWPGNPGAGKAGADTVLVTDPPKDTAAARTAATRTVAARAPNTTPAETWSSGHRNPYGLAFDADGRLWEEEMGPRGGDELNLILPGRNYGWPNASNGDNYDKLPIPDHHSGDGYEAPKLWWNPSISPGGMIIYSGAMFPAWRGSAFIAALSGQALIRAGLTGDRATPGDQWAMGTRIRDVAQAPDGAIWLLTDDGKLLRLTPR